MYYSDEHTHSDCSFDGHAPMAAMAARARQLGLSGLCLTDHADYLDENGKRQPEYDWAPVQRAFEEARLAAGRELDLRLGIELGEASFDTAWAARTLENAPPLDFVLASTHNMSVRGGSEDFYYMELDTPEACYRALDDYFTNEEELLQLSCWDSLAHLLYPLRYMDGQNITAERYRERIDAILRSVIESGRSLECNTCRGERTEENRALFRRYRELGGELVTIGSDAHRTEDLGLGIREAGELLQSLGFRYAAVYRKRKPEMVRL